MAKSTVEKYRVRPRRPPSPSWRAFLRNHVTDLVALDFFTVPTVGLKVLFVLIVLAHDRRKVFHFNVTEHPTAQWKVQQLVEAFPWGRRPSIFSGTGTPFMESGFNEASSLGLGHVLTAPWSPWQNVSAERVIGSIGWECLDQVMVFSEGHLRHLLTSYF